MKPVPGAEVSRALSTDCGLRGNHAASILIVDDGGGYSHLIAEHPGR